MIGELATRLFHSYQTDFAVLNAMGAVVGVVTRDRLISSLAEHGVDHPVSEAMVRQFPVASLDERVYDVLVRMRAARFKAVPVMDGDRFAGMVSMEDISEVYSLLLRHRARLRAAGPRRGRPRGRPRPGDVGEHEAEARPRL